MVYNLDSAGVFGGLMAASEVVCTRVNHDSRSHEGGYTCSPYGETRTINSTNLGVSTNNQRYIGGYMEGSVTYKLGARYYDTTTGRFTQPDPAGQEANPYAYAGFNPINAKDPTGLLTEECEEAFLAHTGSTLSTIALAAGMILAAPTGIGAVIGGVAVGGGLITNFERTRRTCGILGG